MCSPGAARGEGRHQGAAGVDRQPDGRADRETGAMDRDPRIRLLDNHPPVEVEPEEGAAGEGWRRPGPWSAARSGAVSASSRFTCAAVAARCSTSKAWPMLDSWPATVRADHWRVATSCWSKRATR
jgi:hypothetical protein